MLRLVDEAYCPSVPQPSLTEISREVSQAAEHLARAYEMLDKTALDDRARLQFTIYVAVAKLAPVITAITSEIVAGRTRA
jgi:hypothetical protein